MNSIGGTRNNRTIISPSAYATAAKIYRLNCRNKGVYVMCLNTLMPEALQNIHVTSARRCSRRKFIMRLQLGDRMFTGRGRCMANAKSCLSQKVVVHLFSLYNGDDNPFRNDDPGLEPPAAAEEAFAFDPNYGLVSVRWVGSTVTPVNTNFVQIGSDPPLSYKNVFEDLRPSIYSSGFLQEFNLLYSDWICQIENKRYAKAGKDVFVAFVDVYSGLFIGLASSKEEAKRLLLNGLYLYFRYVPVAAGIMQPYYLTLLFGDRADEIAGLVIEKYRRLVKDFTTDYFQTSKILSGIVMMLDEKYGRVVSVATGNKCMDGKYFNECLTRVRDSHAEVLVRRGFVRFLLAQLEIFRRNGPGNCVFVRKPNGRIGLNPSVSFHLYVSSAPCGDCRVYTTSDPRAATSSRHASNTKYNNEGVLRVKLENGCGNIPTKHFNFQVQKSHYANGYINRLLIMSCSDKLLKTNVVGVQGTFLTRFIDPIYYKSIVIGDLYQQKHCTRGLYKRIENHMDRNYLVWPYRFNMPQILHTSRSLEQTSFKQITQCVNWNASDRYVEILNERSGLTFTDLTSRLSSYAILKEYMMAVHEGVQHAATDELDRTMAAYWDYKRNESHLMTYTTTKFVFHETVRQAGLGHWIYVAK